MKEAGYRHDDHGIAVQAWQRLANDASTWQQGSDMAQALSLSPSTVQHLVRKKAFPERRLLSGRRVAWLAHEVQCWADARPVAKLLPPESSSAKKPPTH
jgi:prophage regulatory protein